MSFGLCEVVVVVAFVVLLPSLPKVALCVVLCVVVGLVGAGGVVALLWEVVVVFTGAVGVVAVAWTV